MEEAASSPTARLPGRPSLVLLCLLALFAVLIARTAWVSDDAYITFRTLENLLDGYGLRYNVAERVQSFTHPMWLLLLIPFRLLTGEVYYAALTLSFLGTLAALGIMAFGAARSVASAALGLVTLAFSRAFVDYSTSGLENPLSHALLAAFFVLYTREAQTERSRIALYGLAALVALARMDLALFVLPALVEAFRRAPRVSEVVVGATPFLLWEAFSLFYYGFPFPNTAYAKLGTGIPRSELVEQGGFYFVSSLVSDPLTLVVVGNVIAWMALGKHRRSAVMMLGVVLYLLYVIWIGGDFMAGRFFSAAVFVAVLVVVHRLALEGRSRFVAFGIVLAVGLASPMPPVLSGPETGSDRTALRDRHGIATERAFYYPFTGLLRPARRRRSGPSGHPWARQGATARDNGEAVAVRDTVGLFGYYAGPEVHVVGLYALADPLLARLPARADPDWRPGHFARALPPGYVETLARGENLLDDPALGRYYARLRSVTRDDLFAAERWRNIVSLNVVGVPSEVDLDRYRYFERERVPVSALAVERHAAARRMTGSGIWIELERPRHEALVEIGLDCDDPYRVLLYLGEARVGTSDVPADCAPGVEGGGTVERRTVTVPAAAVERGYDAIWVLPRKGRRPYRLYHVELVR